MAVIAKATELTRASYLDSIGRSKSGGSGKGSTERVGGEINKTESGEEISQRFAPRAGNGNGVLNCLKIVSGML